MNEEKKGGNLDSGKEEIFWYFGLAHLHLCTAAGRAPSRPPQRGAAETHCSRERSARRPALSTEEEQEEEEGGRGRSG